MSMFNIFGSLQALITLIFWVAGMGMAVFGLVDAIRQRPDAFAAAGKKSKNIWLAVLGVAVALSILSFPNVFSLPGILAVVGAGVYLADVRPALRQITGRGSSDGPSGW